MDEYVWASVGLYLDIINLFLRLLEILQALQVRKLKVFDLLVTPLNSQVNLSEELTHVHSFCRVAATK